MTIEQTVDIPASRRLVSEFEDSAEAPAGRIVLAFTPDGEAAAVRGSVRDITPEEIRFFAKQVIEEHRPAFVELAK
jgi:hypothetical protein